MCTSKYDEQLALDYHHGHFHFVLYRQELFGGQVGASFYSRKKEKKNNTKQ